MQFGDTGVLIILLLTTGISSIVLDPSKRTYGAEFNAWVSKSKIMFASIDEYKYRLSIFSENKEIIDSHNRANSSYKLGLNKFAGMNHQEFSDRYLMKPKLNRALGRTLASEDTIMAAKLPRKINWYEKGLVNNPENQGECGSCYSFATNAAIESFYAINVDKRNLNKFSKQYMLDCGQNRGYGLYGCDGGTLYDAFRFLTKYGVILSEDYPYTESANECPLQLPVFFKLQRFENLKPSIERLAEGISKSPVVVGVEMTPSLRFYSSGIVDTKAPCGFFLNHAILAIGYDLDEPKPHFIFKNSYGDDWGDEGFFRMAMGVPGTVGMCGVAHDDNYRPTK